MILGRFEHSEEKYLELMNFLKEKRETTREVPEAIRLLCSVPARPSDFTRIKEDKKR